MIYLSWVWRESWLVETNHDLCYAVPRDGGATWENSQGNPYRLPITVSNAEIAWHIPQRSEHINQTAMSADAQGHPWLIETDRHKKEPQSNV
ncbi:MAG: BNR repeat-containing protein [Duncaniella sp.]|nr:BNR repeat-containing protein [Duncaniella sp.]